MLAREAGRSSRLFLVRRNGRIWRGKFGVIVLPGRYLNDAASFCVVRTAWRARMWLLSLGFTNTQLANGVADFCRIAAMVCLMKPGQAARERSPTIRLLA